MNIKDDAVIADARALAALLGTSVTDAVRRAVHDRLERERAQTAAAKQRKFERIMAIAAEASKLKLPGATSDHRDLYDENGLPK